MAERALVRPSLGHHGQLRVPLQGHHVGGLRLAAAATAAAAPLVPPGHGRAELVVHGDL